jgi:hypothetical protein
MASLRQRIADRKLTWLVTGSGAQRVVLAARE